MNRAGKNLLARARLSKSTGAEERTTWSSLLARRASHGSMVTKECGPSITAESSSAVRQSVWKRTVPSVLRFTYVNDNMRARVWLCAYPLTPEVIDSYESSQFIGRGVTQLYRSVATPRWVVDIAVKSCTRIWTETRPRSRVSHTPMW